MIAAIGILAALLPAGDMPALKLSSPSFVSFYMSMRRWAEVPIDQVTETNRKDAGNLKAVLERLDGDERAKALALPLVDALAATCEDAAAFRKVAEGLPADWQRGPINRAWLRSLADCLVAAEPYYDYEANPVELMKTRTAIANSSVLTRAWDWLSEKLGFEAVPKEIKIFVVPRAPAPGAVTLRTTDGVVIIVSAETFTGTALLETVLHECLHACETLAGKVDVLAKIRASVALTKLAPRDRQQLPHTLYFIAAADAIRQGGAPEHKDVGITLGTYERGMEAYRKHIEPMWRDYLAGKTDRAKLADAIAAYAP